MGQLIGWSVLMCNLPNVDLVFRWSATIFAELDFTTGLFESSFVWLYLNEPVFWGEPENFGGGVVFTPWHFFGGDGLWFKALCPRRVKD